MLSLMGLMQDWMGLDGYTVYIKANWWHLPWQLWIPIIGYILYSIHKEMQSCDESTRPL